MLKPNRLYEAPYSAWLVYAKLLLDASRRGKKNPAVFLATKQRHVLYPCAVRSEEGRAQKSLLRDFVTPGI